MSQYTTGTVLVTSGDATVTGTGTAWLASVSAGDVFTITASGVPYIVDTVTDDTHLELTANYAGTTASGASYSITTSYTPNNNLPYPEQGDIDTATILKRAMLLIDTLLGTGLVAGSSGGVHYTNSAGNTAVDATNFKWDATNKVLRLAGGGTAAALSSGQGNAMATTTNGHIISGYGSTYDVTLQDRNAANRLGVTTGGAEVIGTSAPLKVSNNEGEHFRVRQWTGSATVVNRVDVGGSPSGSNVYIQNAGADTDIGWDLYSKGAGVINFRPGGTLSFAIANGKTVALAGATQSSGAGIAFPATQSASSDANTLDDYEEGTWTPAVAGTSTAGSASYTYQVGRYTKVGRLVHCSIAVNYSTHTGTGNMKITGLPFTSETVASLEHLSSNMDIANLTVPAGSMPVAYIASNSAEAPLLSTPTGGGTSASLAIDAAAAFLFSINYTTP